MTRNTKEVALIQIRSGKLSEMPKALHQSEFGLAKDANRLFIGNAANPALKNREVFPYQNLELLTEYSELKDFFKYSYENNITSADGETDRLKLKEFLPIVISCHTEPTNVPQGVLKINGIDVSIEAGSTMYDIVSAINSHSNETNTYATVFPGTRVITFVCTTNNFDLTGSNPELLTAIGYEQTGYDISMPIRKVTEKLDDNLHISDFAIKGDGENVSKQIFDALVEVYKNFDDSQFYRDVMFPAGTYAYDEVNNDANVPYFTPFPLISNLHVHGEGIDRTILNNVTENTLLSCIDDKFYAEFGDPSYGKGGMPSNILIEDMTFSGSSTTLAKLIGCSNVTFSRVKFTGSGSNKLIEIAGKNNYENNVIYELNNGVVTLKAGSKVYIPNGFKEDGVTPKFDTVIVPADLVRSGTTGENYSRCTVVNSDGTEWYIDVHNFSGDTPPSGWGDPTCIWYDTANNIIKRTEDSGSTWVQTGLSLPVGLTINTNGVLAEFKPFDFVGYIGGVVFALPGLAGLVPNGKNSDGSLANIEERIEDVKIIDMAQSHVGQNRSCLVNNSGITGGSNFYYDVPTSDLQQQEATYISSENKLYRYGVAVDDIYEPHAFLIASMSIDNGNITSFKQETNFLSSKYEANNIVFNECIFENASNAIDIQQYSKNITVNNCKFINIGVPSVIIGNANTTYNVKGITVSGCNFENTVQSILNSEVISLGINSKYTSVTGCTFDDNIIERNSNYPLPYKDNGVGAEYDPSAVYDVNDLCVLDHKFYKAIEATPDEETAGEFDPTKWVEYQRYNYTDILDITENEKKLLRFKFSQPRWEYIDYLINQNGQIILTVDRPDNMVDSPNGLNIVESNNGLDIRAVGTNAGNVSVSLDNASDLELGKQTVDISWKPNTDYVVNDVVSYGGIIYKCTYPHTSDTIFTTNADKWQEQSRTQIIIDRILQLNDNMISNRGGAENVIIEPATDKIIEIQQTSESLTNYEDKIVNEPNAVPNVAFVRNYSTSSLIKHITFDDISSIGADGKLLIGSFPIEQYGNNVHITGVTVNIRNPFYKVVPYMIVSSSSYEQARQYYKGDVVSGTVSGTLTYAVILKTHVAENSIVVNNDNMKIIPTTYNEDIKYVDVLGSSGNNSEYSLVQTYNNAYGPSLTENDDLEFIDIQRNNLFGYTNVAAFVPGQEYGEKDELVSFQDRNYLIPTMEEGKELISTDLHNAEIVERKYDEGFIYKYDEDRNFNIGNVTLVNPYSVNYAGGNVFINLYTETGIKLTSSNADTKLLNPAGDMIVRIDFVKEEL